MREVGELSPDGRRGRRALRVLALAGTAGMGALAVVATLRAAGVRQDHAVAGAAASAANGGPSLYALASFWNDDRGRKLRLSELGGRFIVLGMMFTRCPSACPTLVREIQALERSMPAGLLERTRFVLVSIDPDHDSPEVLRDYRRRMQLAGDRWTLLSGSAEHVRELAALLGFGFAKDPDQGFAHTRLVTLLDPEGRIVHQQAGMNEDPRTFLDVIDRGVAGARRL